MISTLARIEDIVCGGGDPDDVLRSVVGALAAEPGISWAGIVFLDEGVPIVGPQAGTEAESRRTRVPVLYDGDPVAELLVDGDTDHLQIEQVATLVSAHCLVGWDTGGVPWSAQ